MILKNRKNLISILLLGLFLGFSGMTFGQEVDSLKIQNLYKKFDVSFKNEEYEQCRNYAEEILQIDDSNCYAYVMLGIVYGSIPKEYLKQITKEDIEAKAIYCLAVDMLKKAIEVDTLCNTEASKYMNLFQKYFPSMEHFWIDDYTNLEYTFGGWINRKTKVVFIEMLNKE